MKCNNFDKLSMAPVVPVLIVILLIVIISGTRVAAGQSMPSLAAMTAEQDEAKKNVMSQKEKSSYSLGYKSGSSLKKSSVDLDLEIYIKALREGFAGDKAAMTDRDMAGALLALQTEMAAKRAKEPRATPAEANKKQGEVFLVENGKKEGVVTMPSGLQYKVIKEGAGKQPAKTDKVTVNYRGVLINGTEFDSSYKRKQPASVAVSRVIPGWSEGLQLMKEGSKWMLYIPPHLAYGERGARRAKIGPNQTLIFEVELISIQEKE